MASNVKIQRIAPPDVLTLDEIHRFVQAVNERFDTLKVATNDLITTTTPADPSGVQIDGIAKPKIEVPTDTSNLGNFQTDFENGFGPQVKNTFSTLIDELNAIKATLAKNNIA